MPYTVLARRYRSRTFDEVIGQEHVAQTLKRAIESGRIAHAYLFCGTRGTGKTSMARILAKALNCEKFDKPTTTPCGECNSCVSIARGDDMDVIEIDAASNTGVDNVRDIIMNSQFMPARSRFKIYIIDEAHMLSKAAFNALLKTLEEPPSHVKFILATTEPEKLLPTILSRVQRYDFRNIPTREIAGHLKEIVKQEKIKADDDALLLVAKAGAGSMRDSLSLLDRLLSVGEKNLSVDLIEQMLGMPKAQAIFDFAGAIGSGDVKDVLQRASKLIADGLSPDTLIASLVEHLRNLLVLRTCGRDSEMVEVPGISMDDLDAQAQKFDPVVLSQDIAILEELRRSMRTSQAGRALLDATLVRLALAEQFSTVDQLLAGVNGESIPASTASPALKKNVEVKPLAASRIEPLSSPTLPPPTIASSVTPDDDDDLPAPGKVWDNSGPSLSELLKQHSEQPSTNTPESTAIPPAAESSNIEPVAMDDTDGVWKRLLAALAAKGPGLPSLLSRSKFVGITDGKAVIRVADPTTATMLDRNGKKEAIRDSLCSVLQQTVGLSIEVDPTLAPVEPASPPPQRPTTAAPRPRPSPRPQQHPQSASPRN